MAALPRLQDKVDALPRVSLFHLCLNVKQLSRARKVPDIRSRIAKYGKVYITFRIYYVPQQSQMMPAVAD
jgi:hypothetical protein